MSELHKLTANQLKQEYKNGKTTPQGAMQALLERIEKIEPKVKAFAHLPERCLAKRCQAPFCTAYPLPLKIIYA